ncbi:unnamed protein product [Caenorhabditis nigoni]
MLLLIFVLLCIKSSLALVDSVHDTKDSGDLYPMVRQDQFNKNFVVIDVYNNFKTGENITKPTYSTRFNTGISATNVNIYHGLYWEPSSRDEDNYPGEEAVACAYIDVDRFLAFRYPELVSNQSRIEVGQSKTSGNGTVRMKCSRFDGHVRRVSESFSGCYYNETIYRIDQEWEEPNPGSDSSLWKMMSCQKSENGYFENKIVGCSIHEVHNYTTMDNTAATYIKTLNYRLNTISAPFFENQYKKCVESEPGVVKLEEVLDYEPVCKVDNVVHEGVWDDDVKGVRWVCNGGQVEKWQCKIGKNRYVDIGEEHQLPNGCKFNCHSQTNVFKCDESLSMFKVEGKPRIMRKYEGTRFGLP